MNLASPPATPRHIGGYRVLKRLGTSAAGTVVLASSIDRGDRVAIRLTTQQEAGGAVAFARCARHALAHSLVRHPGLARVRGLGLAQEQLRVASEYVEGRSLAELAEAGLDREITLLAILQAARGLEALHARGLTHGRISATSIRYDGSGLFKLLDPGGAAGVGAAMEDLIALGKLCRDVTSRLPSIRPGTTDPELDRFLRRFSGEAGADNYPDVRTAIKALEGILGVPRVQAGLRETAASETLARVAVAFRDAPSARLRRQILLATWSVIAALAVLLIVLGRWLPASRLVGLGATLGFALLLAEGLGRRGGLMTRLRQILLGLEFADAMVGLFLSALLLAVLAVLGELPLAIGMVISSLGLAAACRFALDRPIEEERARALGEASDLVAELRARGVDEVVLRQFVATSMGPSGRPLFEALFGERARREASSLWTGSSTRSLNGIINSLRDAGLDWLDGWIRTRRDDRLRDLVREVEEERLSAEGVYLLTARRRARRIAAAVVVVADQLRVEEAAGEVTRVGERLESAVHAAEQVLLDHEVGPIHHPPLWLTVVQRATGARVRFVAGALLLAGFLLWAHQNQLIPGQRLQDLAAHAAALRDLEDAAELGQEVGSTVAAIDTLRPTEPLRLDFLPDGFARFLSGIVPGVCGLVLLGSSLVRGSFVGLLLIPGLMLMFYGQSFGLGLAVALAAGGAVSLVGVLLARRLE